jgi:hypothetical protein
VTERVYELASSIIAASYPHVDAARAVALALKIVEVCDRLGKKKVLEVLGR